MSKIKNGDIFITHEKYKVIVINYINSSNILIKFEDGNLMTVKYNQLLKGTIKNPFHKLVHNTGYFGVGPYKSSINSKATKAYAVWNNMIERCYSKKYQLKHPTYINCTVDEKWHNYQNFAKWYEENYIEGYELDKDLLSENNKIYSEKTCLFIPKTINLLISVKILNKKLPTGISKVGNKFRVRCNNSGKLITLGTFDTLEKAIDKYETYRINYIKSIAKEYYSKNLICIKTYIALNNYKINNK